MKDSLNHLPKIGARIIKSAVGSALCIAVYYLRLMLFPEHAGIPFYSILAVLWCMQPYTDSTKSMAKQRTIGTFTGAIYGLVFLLVFRALPFRNDIITYFAACAMVIPIIYTTVLLHKKNASFFSCVVFLSITISHIGDADPYLFVLNRVLDTLIGIGIGVGLNVSHIHFRRDNSTLFVSGIDAVLVSEKDTMIPYNKVELNRLIAMGARFTVSTERTPASIMTLMNGVNLKLPVIAMDGAVMYDIGENRYLEAVPLDNEISEKAEKIIAEEGLNCFVNSLFDNILIIYYGELVNEAEKDMFEQLRRSPYRNYTHISFRRSEFEKVIYLMVLAENDKISALHEKLKSSGVADITRITVSAAAEYEGYSYLKIYSSEVSKASMIEKLKNKVGAERVVTFGSIKGQYDIYIDDDGGNSAVKTLKKLYEK